MSDSSRPSDAYPQLLSGEYERKAAAIASDIYWKRWLTATRELLSELERLGLSAPLLADILDRYERAVNSATPPKKGSIAY